MPKVKLLDSKSGRDEFQIALDACDVVGHWTWDAGSDRVRADTFVALLFNLDPEEAEAGLPVSAFTAGIYAPDRARVLSELRERSRDGVPAVVEYRVCSADGILRWVLSRGRFSYDHYGRPLRGDGIIVDITDLQVPTVEEDPIQAPMRAVAEELSETPLEQAAAAAITAFQAILPLNDPTLKARAEALLFDIGRKLAEQEARDKRTRLN